MTLAVLLLLVLASETPAAPVDVRDTVLIMQPVVADDHGGLRDKLALALARAAAQEPRARVFSSTDVAQLADLAAQQQLAACDSDACLGEIGDAMGARYVVFSAVQLPGGERQLELRLLDARSGEIVARAHAVAGDDAALLALVDDCTRELLRVPFPPPPLLLRPLVLGGAAGLAVGLTVGALGGVSAWNADRVARDAASSGAAKEEAVASGPLALTVAVGGAALAVGGAVALAAGLTE